LGGHHTDIDRADEILRPHHHVTQHVTEQNREGPCAKEAFHCLLRGQSDQLCSAKGDPDDVGKDIIRNHQGRRKEEPYHALEDVVHDEMCLHHDQVERHVSPCERGELEPKLTGL
jgi:hypothetical protein